MNTKLSAKDGPGFSASDVMAGLIFAIGEKLSRYERGDLLTLIARISEYGYRRGFKRGVAVARGRPETLPADLTEWRFGTPLDLSPCPDAHRVDSAVIHLRREHPSMWRPGGPFDRCADAALASATSSANARTWRDHGVQIGRAAQSQIAHQISEIYLSLCAEQDVKHSSATSIDHVVDRKTGLLFAIYQFGRMLEDAGGLPLRAAVIALVEEQLDDVVAAAFLYQRWDFH